MDIFRWLYLSNCRELKSLGDKEKEHRYAVCQNLGRQNLGKRAMSEIEANFKTLSKNLLNIGQGVYSSREVRELFVNVVDKVVEPLKQWKLSPEEVSLLMSAYTGAIVDGTVQLEPLLKVSFQRFMKTITVIVTTFHRWAIKLIHDLIWPCSHDQVCLGKEQCWLTKTMLQARILQQFEEL